MPSTPYTRKTLRKDPQGVCNHRVSSPTFQTSKPPSPPTPTKPLSQSTLSTFFSPSHALKLATAPFVLRRSHTLTIPSYAPVTTCCDPGEPRARQEGVEACEKDVEAEEGAGEAGSYSVMVRSVESARSEPDPPITARLRNGFSDAV